MTKALELQNKVFGRLTVLKRVQNNNLGKSMWLCRCTCGNTIIVMGSDLTRGHTKSCGCILKELNTKIHTTHGSTQTRLHRIWSCMKHRCTNPKDVAYKYYGGKGISVCKEWSTDFSVFQQWALKNGYTANLSIDRIDNNKGYSPDNCRWSTTIEQALNKGNTKRYWYKGKHLTLKELSTKFNVKYDTLKRRIEARWSVTEAVETPAIPLKRLSKPKKIPLSFIYGGKKVSLYELEKILGFKKGVLRGRLLRGWDIKDAIKQDLQKRHKISNK